MHQKIWTWLHGSSAGLQSLAVVVGAGAGLGAAVFRWLIMTATRLFTGHDDYSAAAHAANPHLPGLGRWFVLFTPVVAGLVYGPLVYRFGLALHAVVPALAPSPGAYALVGMGAVFAGAARTPITSVLIMFELTGEYRIILPLMLAIALAAGVSKLLSRDTIYTRKLLRRGIDLQAPERALARISVAAAAGQLPPALLPDATLADLIARFAADGGTALPVVDDDGRLLGVVQAIEVERAVQDAAAGVTAAGLARTVPILAGDESLEDGLAALTRNGGAGLPVGADGVPSGWLTHRDLLRAAAGIRNEPDEAVLSAGCYGEGSAVRRFPGLGGPPRRLGPSARNLWPSH